MNILFDLISTQGCINGGAEYVYKVFTSLIVHNNHRHNIICLYDSKLEVVYPLLSKYNLEKQVGCVSVDINKNKLDSIIKSYCINVFFIGIAQRYIKYDLHKVSCKCICVIHDFAYFDLYYMKSFLYRDSIYSRLINEFKSWKHSLLDYRKRKNFINFLNQGNNLSIVTVSNFSKATILRWLKSGKEGVDVLYSPEKNVERVDYVENNVLKSIIESRTPYILIVSANRTLKNAKTAINAFKRYTDLYNPNIKLLTIGYSTQEFENHITLPYLSSSDLEEAYKNSYALLYPTLWEGFGYPPLEQMKYRKPVLASNVCSIKEVLGGAPIYFCPYYESDIFAALIAFFGSKYEDLCERSYEQYKVVRERQRKDLDKLINMILIED